MKNIKTKEEFENAIVQISKELCEKYETKEYIQEFAKIILVDIFEYTRKIKNRISCYVMFETLYLAIVKNEYLFINLVIPIERSLWSCVVRGKDVKVLHYCFLLLRELYEKESDSISISRKIMIDPVVRELDKWFDENKGGVNKQTGIKQSGDFVKQLYEYYEKNMIGQSRVKKKLAVTIKRFLEGDTTPILLVGPTGCGKNLLLSITAKWLRKAGTDIVYLEYDVSRLTSEGFHGMNISDILKKIKEIKSENTGKYVLVYLNEFDKLAMPSYDSGETNISSKTQTQLLTALDRTDEICAEKVLFVLGGAFTSVTEQRSKRAKRIGFIEATDETVTTNNVISMQELKEFGVEQEVLGRIDVVQMQALSVEDLKAIICSDNGEIGKKQKYFKENCGVEIKLTENFVEHLALDSYKQNLGARSIRVTFEKILTEHELDFRIYTEENLESIILDADVLSGGKPLYQYAEKDKGGKEICHL